MTEAASVVGYSRVSTEEQDRSGLSLAHQRQALLSEIGRRGWEFHSFATDTISTRRPLAARQGLSGAFEVLGKGQASVLLASRLDRLCRSQLEFAQILEKADREGWQVVVMEPAVDMTTPFGKAMAGMAAVFAQLERDLISMRTREALAAKAEREGGYHWTKTGVTDPKAVARMKELRRAGMSCRKVADALTLEGFVPVKTDLWSPRTVERLTKGMKAGTVPPA